MQILFNEPGFAVSPLKFQKRSKHLQKDVDDRQLYEISGVLNL